MILFEKAFQFLLCVIEMYIVQDFVKSVNEYREGSSRMANIVKAVPFVIAILLINQWNIPLLNLAGVFLCYILCSVVLFASSLKRLIISTGIAYIVLVCGEIIGECIMSVLVGVDSLINLNNYYTLAFLLLFEKMVSLFLVKLLQGFLLKKRNQLSDSLFKECLILPIATCILFGLIFTYQINETMGDSGKIALCAGCFGLLFANIYVFAKLERMAELMEENKKMELLALKYKMQKQNYDSLTEMNEEHRRFIHDISKYFRTIGGLAEQSNDREIIQLLHQIDVKIGTLDNMQYSSNKILNALLLERKKMAEEKGIRYEVKVEPDLQIMQVEDVDLITMLGNLLDNAIEASENCIPEERFISVHIFQGNRHFFMIDIENSIHSTPVKEEGVFLSTKKDAWRHGIGLKNVKRVVARYGGVAEYKAENKKFKVSLVLPNIVSTE